MAIVFLNGRFLDEEDALISPFDRGFTFGEGVYEVVICADGRPVNLQSHVSRLGRSLASAGINTPPEWDHIESLFDEFLRRNGLRTGFVYIQVTPGRTARNFIAVPMERSTLLLSAGEAELKDSRAFRNGIRVQVKPDIRWKRRDIKTTMLMPQVLAKREAQSAGLDDTIFYDAEGITEGSSSNVFIVTPQGQLVTRPLSHEILAGCTRDTLIRLAKNAGWTLVERPISLAELREAREVFVTSSTYLIVPVTELVLDSEVLSFGCEETRKLQALYVGYIDESCS